MIKAKEKTYESELRDWLRHQIHFHLWQVEHKVFDEDIESCHVLTNCIHIYSGLDKIAETLSLEVKYSEHCDEYRKMQIEFDGVTFFQLVEVAS